MATEIPNWLQAENNELPLLLETAFQHRDSYMAWTQNLNGQLPTQGIDQ